MNKEKNYGFSRLYSKTNNSLYYFCSKVFNHSDLNSVRLSDESGYKGWKYLSKLLYMHEKIKLHIENVVNLLDLFNSIIKNQIIDSKFKMQ